MVTLRPHNTLTEIAPQGGASAEFGKRWPVSVVAEYCGLSSLRGNMFADEINHDAANQGDGALSPN